MRTASDLTTVTQWGVLQTVSGMRERLLTDFPSFPGIMARAPCGSKRVSITLQNSVPHRAWLALLTVSIQRGVPQTVSNMSKVLRTRFLPSPSVTAGSSSLLSSFHLKVLNDVISGSYFEPFFITFESTWKNDVLPLSDCPLHQAEVVEPLLTHRGPSFVKCP